MGDLADQLFKAFVFLVVVAVVGLAVVGGVGAVGGYMLASALGAGKGLAIAAGAVGAVAVPAATGGAWGGIKKWKKERERKKWQSKVPTFTQAATPAPSPAPAPKPAVQPAVAPGMEDAPPVFVDALAKMKELDPEARKKYLDRLRDAFPDEVETLHKYNDGMALSHDTAPMKKITLVGKPSNTAP